MSFAFAVPFLEQIISIVGITSGTFLAFIFPAILDTMTFLPLLLKEESEGKMRWRAYARLLQNSILVVVGFIGMIAGLQANIRSMFQTTSS